MSEGGRVPLAELADDYVTLLGAHEGLRLRFNALVDDMKACR